MGDGEEHTTRKHSHHSSPRQHVRRGHFIRLRNGKMVYVIECIVNKDKSNGKVTMRYSDI